MIDVTPVQIAAGSLVLILVVLGVAKLIGYGIAKGKIKALEEQIGKDIYGTKKQRED